MQACMIGKMEVDGGNTLLTLPTDTLGPWSPLATLQQCWGSASQESEAEYGSVHLAGVHHSRCSLVLGLGGQRWPPAQGSFWTAGAVASLFMKKPISP